ncbi:phospholipase D-like domain-containing protein [Novosphingobium sp. MW5]|nr:phospholipase D-like domain-containing protein [Novosphingobium sp. MW5]
MVLILPARNDLRMVGWASRAAYASLIGAGVDIHEFTPGLLHAKTLTVDGGLALIGSANLDRRSFELNFENLAAAGGRRGDRRDPRAPAGLSCAERGRARGCGCALVIGLAAAVQQCGDDQSGLVRPATEKPGVAVEQGTAGSVFQPFTNA